MVHCSKCGHEIDDKQFMCDQCGHVRRYIKSNTKVGLYFNEVITTYKQSGLLHTLLYIVADCIGTIVTFPSNVIEWFRLRRLIQKGTQIQPPWVAFPNIPHGSIGWGMGYGEDFLMMWDRWYKKIPREKRQEYQANYPEPTGWSGFYESRKVKEDMR